MKKIVITAIILTALTSISFADEGETAAPKSEPQIAPQAVPQAAAEAQVKAEPQPQAQEPGKKIITDTNVRTGATESIKGKVESVTPADLLTRPRSSMVVVDSAGQTVNFVVKALAVVYDTTGRILTLNNVKPSDDVQVSYITKSDNTKEASSIKVLKK